MGTRCSRGAEAPATQAWLQIYSPKKAKKLLLQGNTRRNKNGYISFFVNFGIPLASLVS